MTDRVWQVTLTVLAATYLVLGAWAAFDAASFTDRVAGFGAYNPHLIHDFAAATATFGLGLLLAARVPSWRTPALTLAALWNGLHAVSHLVDAGDAHPSAVGPVEAVLLVAATALLGGLARASYRRTHD
jgi:hypothetical protein